MNPKGKKSQSEKLHRARSSTRTWVFSQLPAPGCQTVLWRRIGQSSPFLWKLFTVRTREDSLRSIIFGHRIGFFSPFFIGVWCCCHLIREKREALLCSPQGWRDGWGAPPAGVCATPPCMSTNQSCSDCRTGDFHCFSLLDFWTFSLHYNRCDLFP